MKRLILFTFLAFSTLQSQAQDLTNFTYLTSISKDQMIADFGIFIQYGVDLYAVEYTSVDLQGNPTPASGLMIIPDQTYTVYPRLIYQHGTVDGPDDVPSQLQGGYQLALVFGGMGYITLAPDLLGLGVSELFHPYVHADSEAQSAIDMLAATSVFGVYLDEYDQRFFNQQIFVTGYSQGGHSAMATFQKLETDYSDTYSVTAAAPMSGPYDISGAMTDYTLGDNDYFFPAYLAYTALSYQEAYGNLYTSLDEFFKPEFIPMIEQFYNREIGLFDLNDFLINTLIANYGASKAKFSLTDEALMAIENDPDSPVNMALADNDVYDWTPQAPTRMYYCMADDQVTYQNSIVADATMNSNGANDVQAVDVDPSADHGGCVSPAVTATIFFFQQYQSIELVVGTNDQQPEKLQVSPNPAQDKIAFTLPGNINSEALIQLYDLQGRKVSSWKFQNLSDQLELDISSFSAGLYNLEIFLDGKRYYSRLIIE